MRDVDECDFQCLRCFTTMSLEDREPQDHGLCWPCASEYAERLEGALEDVVQSLEKGVNGRLGDLLAAARTSLRRAKKILKEYARPKEKTV